MHSKVVLSFVVVAIFLLSGIVFVVLFNSQGHDITSQKNTDYNVVISGATILQGNLFAVNLTIDPGVIVATDGYSIILSGTFENFGTVCTCYNLNSVHQLNDATNYPKSTGGSGGGACCIPSINRVAYTAGSTMAPGGKITELEPGGAGQMVSYSESHNYTTLVNITNWFKNGIQQYITGAAGGGVEGSYGGKDKGGYGSYGIYIQANTVIEGNITAVGESVYDDCVDASQGAGGGGTIIIAYGNGGFVPGTINNSGGIAGLDPYSNSHTGGYGGNGSVIYLNYQSGQAPVKVAIQEPQWAFDGAFADYEQQCKVSADGQESSIGGTYYINQTITSVNIPLQEFQLNSLCYGQNVTCQFYFSNPESLMAINSTDLNDLNSGSLPGTGQIRIGNRITINSPTIVTGVVVTVNSGSYITDQINYQYGAAGNQASVWISQSSGMVIKFSYTGYSSFGAYNKYTRTVNLIKTNIPMMHPAPKNNTLLYLAIGGIIVAAVLVSFAAYRGGYLDLEKFRRSDKVKRSQGSNSNEGNR